MATRRRRAPKRTKRKTKLVLVLFPIILFIIVLAWLFLEEVKQTLDSKPTQTTKSQSTSSKQPERSTEKILDPERKKLDEILKNR